MKLEDLSPEMREKVLRCETPEEVLALAKKVGHELSDDELEAIAGGEEKWRKTQCPMCLSWDVEEQIAITGKLFYVCLSCGHKFRYD